MVRTNPAANIRTVASVGDKPLPIVAGEPGSSVRARTEEPDAPASPGSRISGRVYDELGRPVPGARVRLAVGDAPRGRLASATTDRSGAFTLNGLRPGSSYTVIAQFQGQDGASSGRVEARAPQTNVRIALAPGGGAAAEQGEGSIRPARARIEPISSLEADEDEDSKDGDAGIDRVNGEDVGPPASEASSLRRGAAESADGADIPLRAGWNVRTQAPASGSRVSERKGDRTGEASDKPPARAGAGEGQEPDDDGPNPLPPALAPRQGQAVSHRELEDGASIRMARADSESIGVGSRGRAVGSPEARTTRPPRLANRSVQEAPRPIPEDLVPPPRELTPESSAPIIVTDPAGSENAWPRGPRAASDSPSTTSTSTSKAHELDDEPGAGQATAQSDAPPAARRPTWAELAIRQRDVPLDESLTRAAGAAPSAERRVITLTSASQPANPPRSWRLGAMRAPAEGPQSESLCRIDPTDKRLVDFRLPALDGKLVSLGDFNADLILLDFWGSWCKECRKSIPHHVELTTRLAGERLQVIGIACERGASLQERRQSAAAKARALGINYPVLVSSMDGNCPVQKGLQIQFYPTMILLDRQGHVLQREHGATDVTLARIDRAIASLLRRQTDLAQGATARPATSR
jgi:hypothetical protein